MASVIVSEIGKMITFTQCIGIAIIFENVIGSFDAHILGVISPKSNMKKVSTTI
jgi:hypothetical protein